MIDKISMLSKIWEYCSFPNVGNIITTCVNVKRLHVGNLLVMYIGQDLLEALTLNCSALSISSLLSDECSAEQCTA